MKPFNIEQAKAGKPVRTRDGRDVRIICWDRLCQSNYAYPIVGLINSVGTEEVMHCFTEDGRYNIAGEGKWNDLFMKDPEPTLDDYTTIKTYEDACKALGEYPWLTNSKISIEDRYSESGTDVPKHIIALMKLETISRALRGGWKPDFTERQEVYYSCFAHKDGEIQSPSIYSQDGDMSIDIPPRLWQETEEKAEYFSTQFIDLWRDYLNAE